MSKFRKKRSDTHVKAIEEKYNVNFNVRSDMKLGNLLRRRQFSSMTAILEAYRGKRAIPAPDRSIFLSFYHPHGHQKGWVDKVSRELGYSVEKSNPISSKDKNYVREKLKERISKCSVLICLIGYGTHNRTWVRWEMEEALKQGKGICGVRLRNPKDAAGKAARAAKLPPFFEYYKLPIVEYPRKKERPKLIMVIEQAAARGSSYQKHHVQRARKYT
ncbi:MAG: TIR domain-containing protein [Candidatus Thiodiazotropha sp. L084R]